MWRRSFAEAASRDVESADSREREEEEEEEYAREEVDAPREDAWTGGGVPGRPGGGVPAL